LGTFLATTIFSKDIKQRVALKARPAYRFNKSYSYMDFWIYIMLICDWRPSIEANLAMMSLIYRLLLSKRLFKMPVA